jgi:hypothetical protein
LTCASTTSLLRYFTLVSCKLNSLLFVVCLELGLSAGESRLRPGPALSAAVLSAAGCLLLPGRSWLVGG